MALAENRPEKDAFIGLSSTFATRRASKAEIAPARTKTTPYLFQCFDCICKELNVVFDELSLSVGCRFNGLHVVFVSLLLCVICEQEYCFPLATSASD